MSSKTSSDEEIVLGTAKFSIKDKRSISFFWQKALSYKHFLNIYLIIREILYKNQLEGDFHQASPYALPEDFCPRELYQAFCHKEIVRALAKGRPGGKHSEKVKMLELALYDWQLFQDLKAACKDLQAKSIYKELTKIFAAFKSFYTKKKQGDSETQPPKTRKLNKVYSSTIAIDQDCISFKRKNIVKINVNGGMVDVPIKHKTLLDLVGSFENIQACEVICSSGELILTVFYRKQKLEFAQETPEKAKKTKKAGLDLGVKNTASYFVDDLESDSVVVDGKALISFNAKNNRKLADLKSKRDKLKENKSEEGKAEYNQLKRLISKLYAKRRDFYFSVFHKLSRRILEDLTSKGVATLFISRNLGECKNKKNSSMGKKNNQKFHEIPLLKLCDYLQLKGDEYGIEVIEIDEAYTSKCSSISGDLQLAQSLRKEEKTVGSNVLNGKRLRRSVFQDTKSGLKFHADINAALNHIRVGMGCEKDSHAHLFDSIWKLANPIKKKLHVYLNALNCFLDVALL